MSTTTLTELLLTRGPLSTIWDTTEQQLKSTYGAAGISNGKILVGYDDGRKYIMLFADGKEGRYPLAIDGHSIFGNVKLEQSLQLSNNDNIVLTTSSDNKFSIGNKDNSKTILLDPAAFSSFPCGITTNTVDIGTHVKLQYNTTTQSLDFLFTPIDS